MVSRNRLFLALICSWLGGRRSTGQGPWVPGSVVPGSVVFPAAFQSAPATSSKVEAATCICDISNFPMDGRSNCRPVGRCGTRLGARKRQGRAARQLL